MNTAPADSPHRMYQKFQQDGIHPMSHAGQFPYPNQPAPAARKPRRWPWVLGIVAALVLGLVIGSASAGSSTPAPANTNKLGAPIVPSAPAGGGLQTETWTVDTDAHREVPPAGTYADGKYEVGAEIEPGTYKTDGPPADSYSGSCYWAKYSDASGDGNSLKSNEIVSGKSTVTIKPGGYMEFSGGCLWTKQ